MAEARLRARADMTDNISPEVGKMQQSVQGFAQGTLRGLGAQIAAAFTVGAIVNMSREVMALGHSLEVSSDNLNVSVESLQAMRAAAREAGVDSELLDYALGRIVKTSSEAAEGNFKLVDAYAKLNIGFADLKTMAPDEILLRIGQALRESGNSSETVAAAYDILGRNTSKFLGLLKSMPDDIGELTAKMKEMGLVIDESYVKTLGDAEKATERFATRSKGFWATIFATVVGGTKALVSGGSWMPTEKEREDFRNAGVPELQKLIQGSPQKANDIFSNWAGVRPEEKAARAKAEKDEYEASKEEDRRKAKTYEVDDQFAKMKKEQAKQVSDAQHRMDMLDTEKKNIAKGESGWGNLSGGDSLARIGGFVGASINPAQLIAEKTLRIQERMEQLMLRVAPQVAEDTKTIAQGFKE